MTPRAMSAAEAAVLESLLPAGLTPTMRDVALCLFEANVIHDERAGARVPRGDWLTQLEDWAQQACLQLHHLTQQMGGQNIYLSKGVVMHVTARDRQMFAEFSGNNHFQLARKYGLTVQRVRQVFNALQRKRFERLQGNLPGLVSDDTGSA